MSVPPYHAAWTDPTERYYGWYDGSCRSAEKSTDREITSIVVDRLRHNPCGADG